MCYAYIYLRSAATDKIHSGSGNSTGTSKSSRRVTFLVNVWLNHVPITASPLPDATSAALISEKLPGNLLSASAPAAVTAGHFVPPRVIHVRLEEEEATTNGGVSNADGGGSAGTGGSPPSAGCCDGGHDKHGGCCDSSDQKNNEFKALSQEGAAGGVTSPQSGDGVFAKRVTGTDTEEKKGDEEGFHEAEVFDMRWAFGEVGDKAEEQVHLRHEVVLPVPAKLMMAPTSDTEMVGVVERKVVGAGKVSQRQGDSFCVEYSGSRKPRVSRIGGGRVNEEDSSEEDYYSEDDDEF